MMGKSSGGSDWTGLGDGFVGIRAKYREVHLLNSENLGFRHQRMVMGALTKY